MHSLLLLQCVYPCVCPSADPPDCPPGVVPERDACGCCLVCPRQLGEPCDVTAPCDVHRGLVCRHRHRDKVAGVCRGKYSVNISLHTHDTPAASTACDRFFTYTSFIFINYRSRAKKERHNPVRFLGKK